MAALDDDAAMHDFRARHGLESMPTLVDDNGSLWAHFGVRVQPAWLFVDADGEAEQVLGELTRDQLFARLESLAGASAEASGSGG